MQGDGYSDPLLGTLAFNSGSRAWECQIMLDGHRVTFAVGGNEQPDPALMQHARDIVTAFPAFNARVGAFLAASVIPALRAMRVDPVIALRRA